jgi:hypothetical protein
MFRACSRPPSEAQQLRLQPLVSSLGRGGSRAVCRGRAGHHHTTTVKPEAATALVELLIMGVRTPETC